MLCCRTGPADDAGAGHRSHREGTSGGGVACRGCWPPGLSEGPTLRRRARAAESARLEIVCGETHRGFKSHRLRHMGTDAHHRQPGEELATTGRR